MAGPAESANRVGPAGSRSADGSSPDARRGLLVLALMLTMALTAVDTTIVSTAVPQIVSDLGGFTLFSWVFSGYLLAQTVTIPVYGKLADLYGRKPVLVVGTVIFLVGSALCAAAWNMPALIVARVVQGLGAGSIQATVLTLAGDLYPIERRGRIQAALSTVWGVAAVAGPTLGGALADYATWRWIFLLNLPLGAAALTLIVRHLHETRRTSKPDIDWAGAALMLGAGVTLILALLQGGVAWPWLSAPSLSLLAASAVLAAATVLVERRVPEPVMPPWIWTRRVLAGINLSQLCIGVILIGPSVFLPVYAQVVLGLGPLAAGLVMASMTMSWPLAAAFCNRLYLRIGFRDTGLIGAVLTAVAAAWVLVLPYRPPVGQLVGATLLLGAGLGLFSPTLVVGAQSTVGRRQRGTVTAAVVFSRYLGQSLGAAVLGAVSNTVLARHLADAPQGLRDQLPEHVDDLSRALPDTGGAAVGESGSAAATGSGPAAEYLRHAMSDATFHVYLGVGSACLLAVLLLSTVIPRRFPVPEDDPASDADPGEDAKSAF